MGTPTKSEGTCSYCGKTFSRAAITRHLNACEKLPAKPPKDRSFQLFVEGRDTKSYWLHLAMPVDGPLEQLDAFLRGIWLECCGHLSSFTIKGANYAAQSPGEDFWETDSDAGDDQFGMDVPLSSVLSPGQSFSYTYDFGSSTELKLKVVGELERGTREGEVELMARNIAPAIECWKCKQALATQICTECDNRGRGWLCEKCAAKHSHGFEMCLPVVNSPRAGVCAHNG